MTFEEACNVGEKADELYLSGSYDEAIEQYFKIADDMIESKAIDSYLVSKLTLGLLLSFIKKEEIEKAFEIWTSDQEENLFGVGVYGLENGQVSLRDTIIYLFISAFMNSLGDVDEDVAASSVSHYMGMIYDYAHEHREILPVMINNWKLHLMFIFENMIPDRYSQEVDEVEEELGEVVPLQGLDFPKPDKWEVSFDSEGTVVDGAAEGDEG